jgi:hypothetical protein
MVSVKNKKTIHYKKKHPTMQRINRFSNNAQTSPEIMARPLQFNFQMSATSYASTTSRIFLEKKGMIERVEQGIPCTNCKNGNK